MSRWPEETSCEETLQQVELFLDGELPETVMARIRSHFSHCPECAAQAHLAREIQHELRGLPELDAPASVLQKIFDQTVRAEQKQPILASLWGRWPRPAWAALAAAALALALGLGVLDQRSEEPAPPDTVALAQATAEARYALAKTGLLTQKAGLVIRDKALRDRIVAPTSKVLSQALGSPGERDPQAPSQGVNDV